MTDKEKALRLVLAVVSAGGEEMHSRHWQAQVRQLAITWPSLAAALADLLTAHGMVVPRPLHSAAVVLRREDAVATFVTETEVMLPEASRDLPTTIMMRPDVGWGDGEGY